MLWWSAIAPAMPVYLAPLFTAMTAQGPGLAELLITKGANVNAADGSGTSVLHYAARLGREDIVTLLLKHGADVSAITASGRTVLFQAAYTGNVRLLDQIVVAGGAVDLKDVDSPVLSAAHSGSTLAIEFLVGKGADIFSADGNGSTALHWAAKGKGPKIIPWLLGRGLKIDAVDNYGRTALHEAASNSDPDAVRLLLENGAKVDARINKSTATPVRGIMVQNYTPLHLAVAWGRAEVVTLLLDKGADVNAIDGKGKTPLKIAREIDRPDLVELLEKRGAK